MKRLKFIRSAILGTACAAALSTTAWAQTKTIDIPAEDMKSALEAYSRQMGVHLVYSVDDVAGLKTQGAHGDLAPGTALAQILGGTDLVVVSGSDGAMLVTKRDRSKNAEAASEGKAAQTANNVGGTSIEEVIVTAEKRDQRLQDVPASVSVVTGSEIAARGVTNLVDLQYSIPNLSLFEISPGAEQIQIGGVSDSLGAPTVGEYLDEMPISGVFQQNSVDVKLLDMERIEVLRGPQGTLYGEGAMGGAIHYVTTPPDLAGYSGSVEASVNKVEDGGVGYTANGVINIPLIENELGLRVVAGEERDAGWIDNTLTGRSNINTNQDTTVRAELLAQPSDRLQLSLMVLHQQEDQANQPFGIDGKIAATVSTPTHNRYDLINGVLKYDFGSVKLVESVGYIDMDQRIQYDETDALLPVLDYLFSLPPGYITQIALDGNTMSHIFTDEVRLSSDGEGPFNWTVGGYYNHFAGSGVSSITTAPGTLPFLIEGAASTGSSSAWAVFGEASEKITDALTALVGLRYYQDQVSENLISTDFGVSTLQTPSATFHTLDPRFNLHYEFSPTSMVYLNVAKGFRSGGFNPTSAGPAYPQAYQPDSIWTYEAGTKDEFFDRRLEIDGDVYHSDWKDVQSAVMPPLQIFTLTENQGNVSGWGMDISATAHVLPGLNVTASYGWNNLAYTTLTAEKSPGEQVDYAVHNSASLSVDYSHQVFGETLGYVRVDYQHRGRAQLSEGLNGSTIYVMPQRDLTNLRVGLNCGRFDVSLFANNLFDNRTYLFPPGAFSVEDTEPRPRTIGIDVRAQF